MKRPSEIYADDEWILDEWPLSRFLCEATQLDCPDWVWKRVKQLEDALEKIAENPYLNPEANAEFARKALNYENR